MSNKLLLFPFGGNAREALSAINAINTHAKTWEVLGFIDDDPQTHGREDRGVKVLGPSEIFHDYPDTQILAVNGNSRNYACRQNVITSLGIVKERFAIIIDPRAAIARDARVGYNTLIMAQTVISCNVSIKDHCIVLPNTSIAHDAQIGDYCCVGANVVISGGVAVAPHCYIGSGARIKENVRIGAGSLVGLGAVVVHDVAEGMVVAGNPARPLTNNKIQVF